VSFLVYIAVLIFMVAGATMLAYSWIRAALVNKKLSIYDSRGFYMVALVFITFVLTSLAYYWGDVRFGSEEVGVSRSMIGVLITLCCSLAGLASGLVRLKEDDPIE